ncbi:MAG: HAD family hydrolase [Hungatella sp.]|jgi:Cof subfamily protein (haloacid dehalogenase superfamily)|nr:HAD family hydrolase [Hungatella sp.]
MNTRLIALDLDGTLLDNQKRLPERNRKALEACISRGIYIVPCTGRTAAGIPEAVRQIPGIRYAITVNGGMLVDMQENKVLDEKLLEPGTVVEIYEMLEEYHVMCDAYIQGDGFSERYCFEHMDEYAVPDLVQELVRKTRVPIDNMKEYIRKRNCMVDKLNLFFDDGKQRLQVRKRLDERGDILVSSSFTFNLEVNGPGASKGEGILRLAQILGVKPEETMAFGDGENDLSMMEKAGIGIAMENGEASLKNKADYIAPCNDDAGVGQMLEKMVLS